MAFLSAELFAFLSEQLTATESDNKEIYSMKGMHVQSLLADLDKDTIDATMRKLTPACYYMPIMQQVMVTRES